MAESIADKSLIEKVKTDFKRIDDGRLEFKRQALVNVMFLYGRHHFVGSQRRDLNNDIVQRIVWELEALRGSKKLRRTSNYILPLFRSLYSRIIRMKANIHAEPTTSTENDRNAARVCKQVGEDFFENCNRNNPYLATEFSGMQAVLMRLILYKMTLGTAYLIPYFNPKAKSFVVDPMTKETSEGDVGEVEVRIANVLNVARDRLGRFTIVKRFLSPEQVFYEFGKDVEPQPYQEDEIEAAIRRLLEGMNPTDEERDGLVIYQKYCIPSKEYPKGQYVACTEKDILIEGDLPTEYKERNPVHEFRYQDLGFSRYGQGAIEQVVDLQQDYNETITRIAHYKRSLTGKVMIPRGSKVSAKWDDEVGQILYYTTGMKPTYENGAQIPQYLMEEIARIRQDMENMMNSHDASIGRVPTQAKSGIAIQTLTERDDAQIAPEMIIFEQRLGFFLSMVIDIMQEKYLEPRLLSITGNDMAFEVKSFIGSDLFGQKKLRVKMGSSLPTTLSERQDYILNLMKMNLISPDRAKDLLQMGDIDGAYTSLDETRAKQDILNIISGQVQVVAELFEDHTIFLKVINDFRKGDAWQRLPPGIRQRINDWATQHQQMLLGEQKAAMPMGGGMPPAAQPPQPQPANAGA